MLWYSGVHFRCFLGCYDENQSVELFYKVKNGWDQSGLTLGYSLAKLLKKLTHAWIYIYKAEKLSVCLSKIRWRPTIFSRPEGRVEVIFAPNEVLII